MEEMLDVYDRQGNFLGVKSRSYCHTEGVDCYHKCVWIWISDGKGRFLVQRRSEQKKFMPGLWDMPSAGHIDSGEKPIDACVRETEEELGFIEKVIIQTKNRKSIPVTEKEIREFYGVMNAQKGTRGIFVTTSTFHPGANALLTSLDNCVGIDGKKLFLLAKKTGYGIHVTKNGFSFDNTMFIH